MIYTFYEYQVTNRMRYENCCDHFRQETGGQQVLWTMTNTALNSARTSNELEQPIKNPYKKRVINVPKVSLSPGASSFTKHKSWLAGSGQRQPPPTHETCFGNKTEGEIQEQGKCTEETEVIHGDHGVFLCRNRDTLFLIVPIQDEWGVPDIEATLRNAASVPDSEVVSSREFLKKSERPTYREQITEQAQRIAKTQCEDTKNDDPQWLKSTYKNIPTMNEISDLLCRETDAVRFLANRGVIDPCGICKNCKGK